MNRRQLIQPVSGRAISITIGTALAISCLTGFVRIVAQSKLDTVRFVADSITSHFERREANARISHMDSTLDLICVKVQCRR